MTGAPTQAAILDAVNQAMSRQVDELTMSVTGVTTATKASTLSMADLRKTLDDLKRKTEGTFRVPAHMMSEPLHILRPRAILPFGGAGLEIRKNKHATEPDGYNWKPSRYRSARVAKKLRNRLGPMKRRKPCLYRLAPPGFPPLLIVHPDLYDNLLSRTTEELK